MSVLRLVSKSNISPGYEPTMAAEDFSFYGQSGIPACFVLLGIGDKVRPVASITLH